MTIVLRKGDKGLAVLAIKSMLAHMNGLKIQVDDMFGDFTERTIKEFQAQHNLEVDGVIGPKTMEAITEAFLGKKTVVVPTVVPVHAAGTGHTHGWQRVACDKHRNGYEYMSLRDDVAQKYNEVRAIVNQYGAIMTSAGGKRSLGEKVSTGRSPVSFHYVGLAFDFALDSGMLDPDEDPYVIERVVGAQGRTSYIVWARCDEKLAKLALPDKRSIKNAVTYSSRVNPVKVLPDYFINLTALLNDYGFKNINARAGFEQGKSMVLSEWWHFQYEAGLIKGKSTFGEQLLKVYTEQQLRGTMPWQKSAATFGVDWN